MNQIQLTHLMEHNFAKRSNNLVIPLDCEKTIDFNKVAELKKKKINNTVLKTSYVVYN